MDTLGGRLKNLRNEKGITQKELAAILQVPRDTLANWEVDRGTPSVDMIIKIADYFRVSTDYLLGRINERPIHTIFGLRLKRLREENGLNAKSAAKNLGLEETHIITYEAGIVIPSKNIIERLAHFYNVSPDYLLSLTDDPGPLDNPNDNPTIVLARKIECLPPKERKAMEAMLDVLKNRNDKAAAKES